MPDATDLHVSTEELIAALREISAPPPALPSQQINIEAPGEVIERLTRLANDCGWPLGETLVRALDELERALDRPRRARGLTPDQRVRRR